MKPDHFVVRPDVARALASRRAVVALETTLVTHGLPHPQGVETALALEEEVRRAGATPATIGVLDGAVRVGLSREDLQRLASARNVAKLNLGNFAAVLSAGDPGSTTVAATMLVAHRIGIDVFATGGIGGVHRDHAGGAGEAHHAVGSFDVSADLTALASFPVAVVCAGAKAILDLPRTVERLETSGVPVYGLATDEFPAFYRRSSGLPVDRRFDDVASLARAVQEHFSLGTGTGVVVANPIPAGDELPRESYERALDEALAAVERERVRGRAVTPFLLERLGVMTGGASVTANLALLRHNARVGAALAAALAG